MLTRLLIANRGEIAICDAFGLPLIYPADTRRIFNKVLARAGTRREPVMPPKFRSIAPI